MHQCCSTHSPPAAPRTSGRRAPPRRSESGRARGRGRSSLRGGRRQGSGGQGCLRWPGVLRWGARLRRTPNDCAGAARPGSCRNCHPHLSAQPMQLRYKLTGAGAPVVHHHAAPAGSAEGQRAAAGGAGQVELGAGRAAEHALAGRLLGRRLLSGPAQNGRGAAGVSVRAVPRFVCAQPGVRWAATSHCPFLDCLATQPLTTPRAHQAGCLAMASIFLAKAGDTCPAN